MIDEIFFLLDLLLSAGGLPWKDDGRQSVTLNSRERARVRDAWRQALARAGFRELRADETVVAATREGLEVRAHASFGTGPRSRVEVRGLGWAPGEIEAEAETDGLVGRRNFGARELELGDPAFDHAVALSGEASSAHALLDAATRRLLARLVAGGLEASGGPRAWFPGRGELRGDALWLRFDSDAGLRDQPDEPLRLLPALLAVVEVLRRPPDLPERLAANTAADPLPSVRLANLSVLTKTHPGSPRTRQALLRALTDASEEVRLHAAIRLGGPGRGVLARLAGEAADEVRARAVQGLGRDLGVDRCLELLDGCLRCDLPEAAQACLLLLGRHGGEAAIERLGKALLAEPGLLAVAAARGLGETRDRSAELPLLRGLSSAELGVLDAVAQALGQVGTATAVPALRVRATQVGDSRFAQAARQAIAAIQARLVGAGRGQLSLASAEPGQLSLADDQEGRLELTRRPAGS